MDDHMAALRNQLQDLFSDMTTLASLESDVPEVLALMPGRDVGPDLALKQALEDSQERFKALFDEAPVGYHELDVEGRITRVNRAELQMLGYTAEEMLGRPVWEFARDSEACRKATLDGLAGQMRAGAEEVLLRRDGSALPVLVHDWPAYGAGDSLQGLWTASQDISERQQIQEAMARQSNLLRALMDALPDPVFVQDASGRYTAANLAFTLSLGMGVPDDIVGKSDIDLFPAELAEQYHAGRQAAIESNGLPVIYQVESLDAAGNRIQYETTQVALRDTQGRVTGILGMSRDIVESQAVKSSLADIPGRLRRLAVRIARLARSGSLPFKAGAAGQNKIQARIKDSYLVDPLSIHSPGRLARSALNRWSPLVLAGLVGVALLWVLLVSDMIMNSPFAARASKGQAPAPALPTSVGVALTTKLDPQSQLANWSSVDIRELAKDPSKYNGAELHYAGDLLEIQTTTEGTLLQVWVPIPDAKAYERQAVAVFCRCLVPGAYKGRQVELWGYGGGAIDAADAPGGKQPLILVTAAEYLSYKTP